MLPVTYLSPLLHESCLNAASEDEIYNFILLVHKNQPNEPIDLLFNEVRADLMSQNYIKQFLESEIVPIQCKQSLDLQCSLPRKIPKSNVRCLLLGACDNEALEDVKLMFINCSLPHVVTVRADKEFNVNFSEFNSIFVFGFYKFWNPDKLSKDLYDFLKNGGGVMMGLGAIRSDDFGIGEPMKSILPFELIEKNPIECCHFLKLEKKLKVTAGSKTARLMIRAKGEAYQLVWDDGIPFIIKKKEVPKEGIVAVLNALPFSSKIIDGQWDRTNKAITRHIVKTIVMIASTIRIDKC
ncbi:BTB/POZ domain containing protein [Histomonas meleagridis]|nr:BTB/POZ domain containing protein [Histomonas meleagridis]